MTDFLVTNPVHLCEGIKQLVQVLVWTVMMTTAIIATIASLSVPPCPQWHCVERLTDCLKISESTYLFPFLLFGLSIREYGDDRSPNPGRLVSFFREGYLRFSDLNLCMYVVGVPFRTFYRSYQLFSLGILRTVTSLGSDVTITVCPC